MLPGALRGDIRVRDGVRVRPFTVQWNVLTARRHRVIISACDRRTLGFVYDNGTRGSSLLSLR